MSRFIHNVRFFGPSYILTTMKMKCWQHLPHKCDWEDGMLAVGCGSFCKKCGETR